MLLSIAVWVGICLAFVAVCILIWYIIWRLVETSFKFNAFSTADETMNGINLTGKVAIITGSNSGLGKETAKIMAKYGCTIIMPCRTLEHGRDAINDIISDLTQMANKNNKNNKQDSVRSNPISERSSLLGDIESQEQEHSSDNIDLNNLENRFILMPIDLASLQSIYEFAIALRTMINDDKQQPSINKIDYLINNAGVIAVPKYRESKDGYELQFAVNHLGHWYLTHLLLPYLKQYHTRIINVSSYVQMFARPHKRILELFDHCIEKRDYMGDKKSDYGDFYNYGISKLCNLLHARSLFSKYGESDGIIAVSLHPGTVGDTGAHFYETVNLRSGLRKFWRQLLNPQYYWEDVKTISHGTAVATITRCVSMSNDEIRGGHWYVNCRSMDDANKLYRTAKDDKYEYNNILRDKLEELSMILVENKGFKLELE